MQKGSPYVTRYPSARIAGSNFQTHPVGRARRLGIILPTPLRIHNNSVWCRGKTVCGTRSRAGNLNSPMKSLKSFFLDLFIYTWKSRHCKEALSRMFGWAGVAWHIVHPSSTPAISNMVYVTFWFAIFSSLPEEWSNSWFKYKPGTVIC